MSRKQDSDIEASVLRVDLEIVYNNVVLALTSSPATRQEIELLGKSHALPPGIHFLKDGPNIAIPTTKLVQAFIVARRILFKYLEECPQKQEQNLRDATAVVLLMDPEHLTAANARKKLLLRKVGGDQGQAEFWLRNELIWVDGYLTSHLHRHTKSPTLWGHRRWVLEKGRTFQIEHDIFHDLESVVLVAAERHPKNYYAWSHLRWLHKLLDTELDGKRLLMCHTKDVIGLTQDWCLKHPEDTSGFSFLLGCLSQHGSKELASSVCRMVLRLTISFQWTHESVWVFLRTLAASGLVTQEDRAMFFKGIDVVLAVHPQAEPTLKSAREWCVRYESRT